MSPIPGEPRQQRRLGVDWGTRRTGVALSDALGLTARGIAVFDKGPADALDRIAALAREHDVLEIVVGIPRNMNDTLGPQAEKAEAFACSLQDKVDVPVRRWDERLSSVQAERDLRRAGFSRQKRKRRIDRVAAALILQNYLDSLRARGDTA